MLGLVRGLIPQEETDMSTRSLSVSLLALALSAGTLPALDNGGRVRDPGDRRRAQLASMSASLAPFAEDTWPAIAGRFDADPGGAFNARLVMVAISLANADVDRFELGVGPESRLSAIERLEDVVARQAEWTGRAGSGGAAVYLAMTARRLSAECDLGGDVDRVQGLVQASEDTLRSEATMRSTDGTSFGAFPEEIADSAAVFSGAAMLLPVSEDTPRWEAAGRTLGQRVLSGCTTAETLLFGSEAALSYLLAGRGIPRELTRVPALSPSAPRCRSNVSWSATESSSGEAASLDDRTKAALAASRSVAVTLLEHYLWIFRPGSAPCPGDPGDPDPFD
jgi:hypothetical protein